MRQLLDFKIEYKTVHNQEVAVKVYPCIYNRVASHKEAYPRYTFDLEQYIIHVQ